jgi:diguanylate cyclase (GGDEF)-like protein
MHTLRRPGGITTTPDGRPPDPAMRFVQVICVAGVVAIVISLGLVTERPALGAVALAFAVVGLGELQFVHIRHGGDNHAFNWSEAALVAGLVLLPSWWLPLVGTIAVAAAQRALGRTAVKVAFNASGFAIGASAATGIYHFAGSHLPTASQWLALALACLTCFVWNTVTVAVVVALAKQVPIRAVLFADLPVASLFGFANSSVGIFIAVAATREPLVLLAVPPIVVQLLFAYRNTREVIGERDLWVAVQSISADLQRADDRALPRTALRSVASVVEGAAVELLTVDGGRARRYRLAGEDVEEVSGSVAELADDVWGRVECDRTPFWLQRATASPRQRQWLVDQQAVSTLVVPLEWSSQLVGMVRVSFSASVDHDDRLETMLSTIATHIASALTSNRQTATLRHQAEHDELTGLPNRKTLVQHLDARLQGATDGRTGLAVLFFDLDEFKVVNDSLGHHVGDQLLLDAAQRLRSEMRPQDLVARFGGDEFIVLCDGLAEPEVAVEIAQRLLDALAGHADVDPHHPISASVGIAYTDTCTVADALLRDADAAMYQAKRNGPGSVCLFTAELRTQALDRLHLEADLRVALRNRELEVHYQPIVDVRTGQIRELEALVRWHHPLRGAVSPEAFISVAEESGHIRALGEFVLNQACADMRRWLDLGLAAPGQRVAVNLSRLQLDRTLPTVIGEALARHGLPASALALEVTESAFVDDPDGVASLERLRDIGVRVALDDFGTGYSSLSTLRDLPADTVKVDRSFVARVCEDEQLHALVRGIVELAHALHLVVVAEGVETPEQADLLAAVGCDLAQGWLHGRPVSAGVIEAVLSTSAGGARSTETAAADGPTLRLA